MKTNFPFTAIAGQEEMKQALLLNLVLPSIGGVLIRGQRGTAKSTAVRALTDLLDGEIRVVNLPIGATEDRVVGTIDMEHALKTGEKRFEPGLLSLAHGNILYVDEINLLPDYLVDLLLDAAAMGVNTVEREGISYSHPAEFILVGTMNPEEGDLRPQLLDRFGLSVDVEGENDVSRRQQIIRHRVLFEDSPEMLLEEFAEEQEKLKGQILRARTLVREIEIPESVYATAARVGVEARVDGHRGDITLIKAAIARCALNGRNEILPEDFEAVLPLVFSHRMKRLPFESRELDPRLFSILREFSATVSG